MQNYQFNNTIIKLTDALSDRHIISTQNRSSKCLILHHGTTYVPSDEQKNLPEKLSTENSSACAHRLLQHTYPSDHYEFSLLLEVLHEPFLASAR